MENNISINNLPKIRNGRLWYVVLLPAIGLFLESFATNKWIGLGLWISIITISVIVCIRDEKHLRAFGVSHLRLYKARFFPPLYIYRRLTATHQSYFPFGVFMALFLFALINNGFTTGLTMNDDDFILRVQINYVSAVKQFEDLKSTEEIEQRLEDFAIDDTLEWSYSENDKHKYVTVTGLCNYDNKSSQRFELVFSLDFDGYAITKIEIIQAEFSKQELNGKEKDEFLKKIFIEQSVQENSNKSIIKDDYKNV